MTGSPRTRRSRPPAAPGTGRLVGARRFARAASLAAVTGLLAAWLALPAAATEPLTLGVETPTIDTRLAEAEAQVSALRTELADLSARNVALADENATLTRQNDELALRNGDLADQVDALTDQVAALTDQGERLRTATDILVELKDPLWADSLVLRELRKELPDDRAEAEAHLERLGRLALDADPAGLGQLVSRLRQASPTYLDWRFAAFATTDEAAQAYVDSGAAQFDLTLEDLRQAILLSVANRLEGILQTLDRIP
jgi:regulator of replication initiation timing